MIHLPTISILTPTYNRGGTYLAETIYRVQRQRERGFTHEHIIVDNASTDNTEEVVRSFMKEDPRIKYIRNDQNLWASGALNVALQHSVGELIVPLDDDDIVPEHSLQIRFDAMRDPKVMWTSGYAVYIDKDGALFKQGSKGFEANLEILPYLDDTYELKEPDKFFHAFFTKWLICSGTVTVRRKCIEEVGGWDASFQAAQDTEMWTKLAAKRFHHKLIAQYILFYRVHPAQASGRNAVNGVWVKLRQELRERYGITDQLLDGNIS